MGEAKYRMYITCVATGEEVEYIPAYCSDSWNDDEFLWTEGNNGCDCNRHNYWYRAKDTEPPGRQACGDSAYIIRVTTVTGGLLYEEKISDRTGFG